MKPTMLAAVLASALLGAAVSSAEPGPPAALNDYRITSWVGGDGITLGEIRSLAQDQNGYLWLASERGLVRFDGFRFSTTGIVFGNTPLPVAPSRAVYVARDGSLWVGYGNGLGIYRIVDGEVRGTFLQKEVPGYITAIVEDRSGSLWVAYTEGLYRFRDGRWEPVSFPGILPAAARIADLHVDRAGTLWASSLSGGLYRQTDSGSFEQVATSRGVARGISEDADGRVWTTDEMSGFRSADGPSHGGLFEAGLFEARGMNVLHDRRGNIWVTTIGQGIWQVQPGAGTGRPVARQATVRQGLVSDENSDILEDRDGNIWVASLEGLNRLTPHKVNSLPDLGVVHTLTFRSDGTALAGTTAGLIALSEVTARSPGTRTVLTDSAIRTLHTSSDGTVWVATDSGLHRLRDGHLVPVHATGLRLSRITSISSDERGALWICDDSQGLVRFLDGRVERVEVPLQPRFTHVDAAGRLWMAFEDGTVGVRSSDGVVTRYGRQQGLLGTAISTIQHDRRGDIWIGSNAGLSRLRGDAFETLTTRNGLPWLPGRPMVTGIIDDDDGNLWVAIAYKGVVRIGHDEVERGLEDGAYRLRYRVYNTSDGVAYTSAFYTGNAAVGGANGTIWFVASRGVTVIDPRELREEPAAALGRPRIEGVLADARYFSRDGSVLPTSTSRLAIDYTKVDLSTPQRTQFRYRLDGFDREWVDGSASRRASYTNLPPGQYRFRLQASSDAMTLTDAEAAWSFSIEPMFYQTRWFYALCAIGLALCVTGAYRLRLRQLRRDVALVFGERIRLAREIHDTLLQSLVGLALQLDSAYYDARDQNTRTHERLLGMRKQIEGYIREARRSIWDLRSPSLEAAGLVGALRVTGDRLTAGSVRFALTVTGTPRACPANLETHVLRIGHEAVMNAVRHASARNVHMEIRFGERVLGLRVADDGRGFDAESTPAPGAEDHYGLAAMRERAVDAGGRCTIESTPGAGVQVTAEFPLAAT